MAAVMASFIVQETGQTAIDDGTTATLLANFTTAVVAASKQRVILTDTGARTTSFRVRKVTGCVSSA